MSGGTRLGGPLREHLAAAVAQLGATTPYSVDLVVQDVRLADGTQRLFQDYYGDLSGRFLDAVAVARAEGIRLDDEPGGEPKTTAVLREILASQNADGFFGLPAPAMWVDHGSAWGHGRLLDGLLSTSAWAPAERRAAVTRATERLADAITGRADRWATWVRDHVGQKFDLDPLSAVLPLTRYAEAAGSKPALYAARTLASALPPDAEDAHMHGYLLALRGQLELARQLGDDDLLDDVVGRADAVADRHLLPHGAVLESLSWPWDVNTEACAIADWVMLNLRLYELLGATRHLDRALVATFNALLHTQRESGHFGCETLSEADGLLVSDYAPEAWWCCTFHGIRALHTLAEHAVVVDGEDVRVVVPIATSTVDAEGRAVVDVSGNYPYADTVTIEVGPGFPDQGRLRLRIPSTATVAALAVDGVQSEPNASDGWLTVADLRPGGRVELRLTQYDWFDVGGEPLFPPFENTTEDAPDLSGRRCAVFHGPLLLAAHAGDNPLEDVLRARSLVHEPTQRGLAPDAEGRVSADVSGHDTFHRSLVLSPLADADRRRNDQPVRAWYAGLRYAPRRLHW